MDPKSVPNPESLLSNADFVRRVARSLLFDAHAVEDAVQGTWVAALQSPPDGEPTRGWLGTVVRNLVRQRRRGDERRARREATVARRETVPSVDEVFEREAIRKRVLDAVVALDEPYRTAVLLRYYDELPPREIADRLNLPVETVRTRIKRALNRLRDDLDEAHGDRDSWSVLLLPCVGKEIEMAASAGTASVWTGSALLKAAAAILAVGGGGYWWSQRESTAAAGALDVADTSSKAALTSAPSAAVPPSQDRTAVVGATVDATPIEGIVLAAGGTPIGGAVVLFSEEHPEEIEREREWRWDEEGPHDHRVVTDDDGRFVLARFEATRLWARLHRLAPGWYLESKGRWVEPGGDYVFQAEGLPIATIRVRAREAATGDELVDFAVSFDRVGDDYERDVATDGAVAERLLALPSGAASAEFRVQLLDPRVTAEPVVVRVDQGHTAEVVVPFERGGPIHGVVVDATGNALADALVFFGSSQAMRGGRPSRAYSAANIPHAVTTDASGRFAIRGSGEALTAWHADHSPTTVAAGAANRIQLEPRAALTGRIVLPTEFRAELAQAGKLDRWLAERFELTLDRDRRVPLAADGTFELTSLEAGTHHLGFPPERHLIVSVDPGETMHLEVPTWIDDVELVFESAGLPYEPAHGESMSGIVVGLDDVATMHEFGRWDDGKVRVRRIVPGRYGFLERRGIFGLADIRADRAVVDVGDASLRVTAEPGARVWLQPVDANEVVAFWSRAQTARTVPDDGVLEIAPLPAGAYELGVDEGVAIATVDVLAGGSEIALN